MTVRHVLAASLWVALLCSLGQIARAESAPDALQWLQKVAAATRKLNYSGVFVYQGGGKSETSRIVHVAENGRDQERIETLDGSPREIVRDGNDIKCYLPESRLVVVERRFRRQNFPSLLPEGIGGLTDHYVIHRGMPARIAGYDTQSIVVEPRDDLRYRRQFWVDSQTGLPLKAGLFDEKGEVRETFAFTELKIGGTVEREALKPHSRLAEGEWRVHDIRPKELGHEDDAWALKTLLPGFMRISTMKRPTRQDSPSTTHMVFSDGLAAISVFIEPLPTGHAKPETGAYAMGALNVYKRLLGEYLLVAMGDVPLVALRKLTDGIELKKK